MRALDLLGGETTGCVLHGAVLLAAHELAQSLEPLAWRGDQAAVRAAELLEHQARRADRAREQRDTELDELERVRALQVEQAEQRAVDWGPHADHDQVLRQASASAHGLPLLDVELQRVKAT
ncbi:hypothetical protein [Catellatospora sp. NPDC049609]|uniref:hypothetical protein n=1 Tax=Catellatospora sp. NPDC049609 TaxID=3155505 RepID=UPI0034473AE0